LRDFALNALSRFQEKTMRDGRMLALVLFLILGFIFLPALRGQESQQKAEAQPVSKEQTAPAESHDNSLQKASQNPVANLISFPLQDNTNFGIGPFSRNQNVLNIQPVIPVKVSENWNVIIRWIWPVIWQPASGN
jgi:hypothetical protein